VNFWQTVAATTPAGAAPFTHTKAISFDGSTEYMANTTAQNIGISNVWTINIWINFLSFPVSSPPFRYLATISPATGVINNIGIYIESASGKLSAQIFSSSGSVIKDFTLTTSETVGVKTMLSVSWDGTNYENVLYRCGGHNCNKKQ